jgi:hypothetical protein
MTRPAPGHVRGKVERVDPAATVDKRVEVAAVVTPLVRVGCAVGARLTQRRAAQTTQPPMDGHVPGHTARAARPRRAHRQASTSPAQHASQRRRCLSVRLHGVGPVLPLTPARHTTSSAPTRHPAALTHPHWLAAALARDPQGSRLNHHHNSVRSSIGTGKALRDGRWADTRRQCRPASRQVGHPPPPYGWLRPRAHQSGSQGCSGFSGRAMMARGHRRCSTSRLDEWARQVEPCQTCQHRRTIDHRMVTCGPVLMLARSSRGCRGGGQCRPRSKVSPT